MEDIRINRKNIKSKLINSLFLKLNFVFYNKILLKYDKKLQEDSTIFNQSSFIFLMKSEFDDDELLKSISEIVDILKKKEDNNTQKEEDKSELKFGENESIKEKEVSSKNNYIDNSIFSKKSLIYNNFNKRENFKKIIKYLISNVSEKINNNQTNVINKDKNGSNKILKSKIGIKKGSLLSNKKSKNDKVDKKIEKTKLKKVLSLKNDITNYDEIEQENIEKSKKESSEQKEQTLDIKKISYQLKKINDQIIDKKIKSIKIDKIGYDIVDKSVKFNKKIYSKVNKTISSLINSDSRVKYFSRASRDIVLFNKKFKNYNVIKDLQDMVVKYKKEKVKVSRTFLNQGNKTLNKAYNTKYLYNKIKKSDEILENQKNVTIRKKSKINRYNNRNLIKNDLITDNSKKIIKKYEEQKYINLFQKNFENNLDFIKNKNHIFNIRNVKSKTLYDNIFRNIDLLSKTNTKSNVHDLKNQKFINNYDYSYFSDFLTKKIFKNYTEDVYNNNFEKKLDNIHLMSSMSDISLNRKNLLKNIRKINQISSLKKIFSSEDHTSIISNYKTISKKTSSKHFTEDKIFSNLSHEKIFRKKSYKNDVELKKMISECVNEKLSKNTMYNSKNVSRNYNERLLRLFEKESGFSKNSQTNGVSKKEVKDMIKNAIYPINLKRITDIVMERIENKNIIENKKNTIF